MTKVLTKLIGFLYALLVLTVPLIFWADIYTTFEIPKVVCFQVITALIAILFAFKRCFSWKVNTKVFFYESALKNKKISWVFWFGGLFVLLVLMSTFWGKAPTGSIFGLYPRFQGAITQLLYLALGMILFLELYSLRDEKIFVGRVSGLVKAMLTANFIMCVVAILEKINLLPFGYWDASNFLGRVFSTMGHPDFLAMQIILVVPLIVAKIIENKELKKGFIAWFWRKLLVLNLIISLIALYYTLSRAAIVGLVVALFIFVLLFTKKVQKKFSFAFMVLLPVLIVIGLLGVNVFADNPAVKDNQILSRFVFNGESLRSAEARFVVWPEVVKTIAARPILGYGPDSFGLAFEPYFPAQLNDLEKLGDTSDRAHNFVLDLMVQYGFAGVGLFLGFFIFVLVKVSKYLKEEKSANWLDAVAIFCALIGALIAAMFGFFVTANTVYMVILLAILLAFIFGNLREHNTVALKKNEKKKFLIFKNLLGIIVLICILYLEIFAVFLPNLSLLKADFDFRYFYNNQKANNVDALNHAVLAATENENFAFYGYEFAAYLAKNPNANYLQKSLDLIEKAGKINNFDAFYHFRKAVIEGIIKQNTQADFDFKQAIDAMPNYAPFYFEYGKFLVNSGENSLAVDALNKYLDLSPKYWQWKNELVNHTPEEREQYRIFYKLNPKFDEVFDLLNMAKSGR